MKKLAYIIPALLLLSACNQDPAPDPIPADPIADEEPATPKILDDVK